MLLVYGKFKKSARDSPFKFFRCQPFMGMPMVLQNTYILRSNLERPVGIVYYFKIDLLLSVSLYRKSGLNADREVRMEIYAGISD